MDYYGISNKGPFIHEKLATLPVWQATDEGRQVYAEDVDKFYIGNNSGWVLIGGGGSTYDITQTSHTLNVGNVVKFNTTGFVYDLAQADSEANAEVIGIVSADLDANTFTLCVNGYVTGLSGLTAGACYFLSDSVAGALTATEPTTEGSISKPCLIADSTTSGYFFNMRGVTVGGGSTSYITTFTNASLSTGILTVQHNFGHLYVNSPVVIDNNGKIIIPDEIEYKTVNTLEIDLSSYGVITGTWRVIVLDSGASGSVDYVSNVVYNPADWNGETGSAPSMDVLLKSLHLVNNLNLVVNADVNKLDIFTKSGSADPDANNFITVAIPDGNGYTFRSRGASYLSGTSQIVMDDGANYWSKGSFDEIKTAWLYAIWDGTGIVWALGGYSGFTVVPTTTTATDDDYFLLEDGSTYTRSASHYCVTVCKIRYQYDTADTPDHTIQASGENIPQIRWNAKSDYSRFISLATQITSGSNLTEFSVLSGVVKQSGKYLIQTITRTSGLYDLSVISYIKTGSATYGSAAYNGFNSIRCPGVSGEQTTFVAPCISELYLTAGSTIHFGLAVSNTATGTITISGDDIGVAYKYATNLRFQRVD